MKRVRLIQLISRILYDLHECVGGPLLDGCSTTRCFLNAVSIGFILSVGALKGGQAVLTGDHSVARGFVISPIAGVVDTLTGPDRRTLVAAALSVIVESVH